MKLINIDITQDEGLSQVLDKMISGLLPHHKFDSKTFSAILQHVFSLIDLEEMTLEYHVMFSSLLAMNKLNGLGGDYSPKLTKEVFETMLLSSIDGLVQNTNVGMRPYLVSEGHPDDLTNVAVLETAKNKLYERCMDLYDRAFEIGFDGSEAISLVPAYKESFIACAAEVSLNTQREILDNSVKIGRRIYTGSKGWMEYARLVSTEVMRRTTGSDDNRLKLDDMTKATELLEKLKEMFVGLADYGIPMLDDETPMLKHRLVVICGNEGAGKTLIVCNQIVGLLRAKRKVKLMCGETTYSMYLARILSNYIFQEYGKHVGTAIIGSRGDEEIPADIDKYIKLALAEIVDSGALELMKQLSYEGIYDELKALYEEEPFDAAFIDHTLALKSNGRMDERERLDCLAVACRDFKVDYPVFIELLSHLSADAKKLLAAGKRAGAGPARGSSIITQEADEVFVLMTNPTMKKQKLIALDVNKRRSNTVIEEPIILKLITTANAFEYKPENQQKFNSAIIAADSAVENIKNAYADDEDDLDEDEWD